MTLGMVRLDWVLVWIDIVVVVVVVGWVVAVVTVVVVVVVDCNWLKSGMVDWLLLMAVVVRGC